MVLFIVVVMVMMMGVRGGLSEDDTYLDAYAQSHNGDTGVSVKSDRGYNMEPLPPYPAPQYGPPTGPPTGPSKYPVYGQPVPNYGPPLVPVYGPAVPQYGMPHGMLGLLDKLKLKIDLFTIGKILLKLVIFKKIVSLIAILCLLLFIPSLKHKDDDDGGNHDDDEALRSMEGSKKYPVSDSNYISNFVLEAIDQFSKTYTSADSNGKIDGKFHRQNKLYKIKEIRQQ